MQPTRALLTLLLALAVLVGVAGPAWAHASFDVRQLPAAGSETFELRVPIEIDAANAFVDVLVPAGWTVDDCPGADGWSCEAAPREDGATVVNLEAGTAAAGATELFVLAMTAPPEQGTYSFPVVQTYDDGTEAAWIGEPGADRPAPRIQVGDDATEVERSTELPTHGEGDEQPSATPSPTLPSPSPTTARPTPTDSPEASSAPATADAQPSPIPSPVAAPADDGGGVPVAVWVVAAVALLGVGAAAVLARRRS